MDACYRFPDRTKIKCSQTLVYRVEIAILDMSTFACSFANPTVATSTPFLDIPEICFEGEPEAGTFGANEATFKVNNLEFATDARFDSVLFGDSPIDRQWTIRVYVKSGTDYICKYWGVIQHRDAEIELPKRTDADSWTMTFATRDFITVLEDISATTFLLALDYATLDYCPDSAGGKVWVTDYKNAGTPTSYEITLVRHESLGASGASSWVNYVPSQYLFIKLADLLQAISNAMGITAAVSVSHSWAYVYEYGSADNDTGFSTLYIPHGFLYSAGVYAERAGFFDKAKSDGSSLYNSASVLDVLKRLLIPHGARAQVKVDASGNPYMLVREFIHGTSTFNSTVSGVGILTRSVVKPADRVLSGIKVSVDGGNGGTHVDGGEGDETIAITCMYQSAQCIFDDENYSLSNFSFTKQFDGWLCSLFCRPAASNNLHSIYKINVKNYGQGSRVVTSDAYDADNRRVVAKAAAAYYWNPVSQVTDVVGLYRKQMRRIEVTLNKVAHEYEEGDLFYWTMGTWPQIVGYIKSISFDLTKGQTKIVAESGAW